MGQPLHILIVEDSEDDVVFVVHELQRGGYKPEFQRVDTEAGFNAALTATDWDLVIADYSLPEFSALDALRLLQLSGKDLPFIIVSGAIGEEVAVAAMKSGAHDYILKSSLVRLVPAVERELRDAGVRRQRREARDALRESEDRYRNLANCLPVGIFENDAKGRCTYVNARWTGISGLGFEESSGFGWVRAVHPEEREAVREDWRRAVAEGTHEWSREYRLLTLQGVVRWVHVHVTAMLSNDGKPLAYVGTVEDITQSKRAADALRAAQERLHHLVSSSPAVIYSLKVHGDNLVPTFVSENIEQMTGYASQETLTSKWWVEHGDFHSATSDPAAATILREQLFRRKDGTEIWIRDEKRLLHDLSGRLVEVVGSWSDITKRKLGEEELRTSREQLRALAAHLQSVREEERKRINREIHDELGQSLTGFKMDLAWMRNRLQAKDEPIVVPSLLEKIASMGALVDGTANLVRRLCTELRPGILDDLGLAAAMEWQAREYQSRTGIPCTIRFDLGDLEVDPDRSTALFRIFQEILTNVARHAKATRIEAVIKTVGDFIFLQVSDNGRGITEGEKAGAKSLGLLGMRERAVILGGEVIIEGSPGRGTSITVKVPLPPELAVSVKPINQMGRIPGARPLHKPEGEAIH